MRSLTGLVRSVLIGLIALAVTVFVIQNLAPIEVQFIVWSVHVPRAFGLLAGVALGVALGLLIGALRSSSRGDASARS